VVRTSAAAPRIAATRWIPLSSTLQPLPLATWSNWAKYALRSVFPSYGASGTVRPPRFRTHSPVPEGQMEGRTLRIPAVPYPRGARAIRPDNLSPPPGSVHAPHRLAYSPRPSRLHPTYTPEQSYWGPVLGQETPKSLPPPQTRHARPRIMQPSYLVR